MPSNIDLHTLRVFNEIYQTGSLSRTADRLGLSQPAISMVLGKLRRRFGDNLFVRVGNEMKPTTQAEGMRTQVSAAIVAIEAALQYRHEFNPATTERVFKVAVSDIGQLVMVPRVLGAFQIEAPNAALEFSAINDRTPELLLTGAVDLSVGLAPGIPESFVQRSVYTETFCVLARKGHPRVNGILSLDQFQEEGHIRVVTSSSTYLVIEKTFERQSIHRHVRLTVPNFMIVAALVAKTDWLSVLPRRAGLALAEDNGLQVLDPPFAMGGYKVHQYWHPRQTNDAANRWLRELFLRLFSERS